MALADTLVFGLDYPTAGGPLYSNVNFASGHCFHAAAPVEAITLSLNGRYQDAAILGYPRLDVNQAYPGFGDRSLLSGFQCFFDSALLTRGESRFDFDITVNGAPTRVTRVISPSTAGAVKISDVFIDIVGPCNLKCAMCPQGELEGTRGNRGRGFMPIDLFDRVLSRLRAAGYVGESINLYNWGDPLLHPALGRILDICEQNQYRAIVSTNLSFPEARVQALTEHAVELLLVSVSGFSPDTYGRNHVGGDFALIRRNLEGLRRRRGRLGTIVLKYLVFRYNKREIECARAFAEDAGFEFGAYLGAIPSAESFFKACNKTVTGTNRYSSSRN
jgi:pyruvate-formate lyase-activating enzyme